MGGRSSQVIGYKYYSGLMVVIGNTIEKLVGINPDNRGWLRSVPPMTDGSVFVNEPNLFGGDKQEGGWAGWIDLHTGKPDALRQNPYLALHDSEIVSAFPNMSYLIYRGLDMNTGFQLVSMSGTMKEVMYCVKRVHIKNDGTQQWNYDKAEISTVVSTAGDEPNLRFTGTANVTSGLLDGSGGTSYTDELSWVYGGGNPNFNNWFASGGASYQQDFPYHGEFPYKRAKTFTQASINSDGMVRVIGRFTIIAESFLISGTEGSKLIGEIELKSIESGDPVIRIFEYSAKFDLTNSTNFGISITAIDHVERGTFRDLYVGVSWAYFYGPYPLEEEREPTGDINPIHKIREILTDDTAMNKPESDVNDVNFLAAANRIWDEQLGISWAIQEKSCKDAIDELLYHIEAGIRVNRQTGLYEVILFRDDLLYLDDAMSFNESNIKTFSHEIAKQDDLTNSLNVKYYDRATIKESSFSVYDNGSIFSNGNQEITESIDFPYFMNRKNAELVANWKLKQLSTPTWKGSFTTGKYEARKLNKYDVIKLSWLNANLVDLPVRVMKISIGDGVDNTVTIDWVEVIPYSTATFQPINVDPPTNPILPAKSNYSKVFEMPYFEAVQNFGQTQTDIELSTNPDIGYLSIASKRPQNNSINALLYTDSGSGYRQRNTINYCPTLVLDQDIDYLDDSFAVKDAQAIASASIGSCFLLDDEIMVYQAYNPTTKVITVKRGALDTVPQKHIASAFATLFFYDAFSAFDTNQYLSGETISAKSLTTTPSSVLSISDAAALPLEIKARAVRPYPAANVKINDEYYPLEINTDLIVTWVDRNRLQQTGGEIIGWQDGNVTIENGTSTFVIVKELDINDDVLHTHTIDRTGFNTYTMLASSFNANTRFLDVSVKTVRDGYDSYQNFNHKVKFTAFFSAPYNITYSLREV